jgi:hypothetical protein
MDVPFSLSKAFFEGRPLPQRKSSLMTLRLTVIALALLSAGVASSNPPSPAQPKAGQHQERHTNQSAENAKSPDDNSNNAPLPVTLNGPVTTQKSERDRNDEREESERKASNERWLIIWTSALAFVTLALAGITGVLAKYTYKLWSATNKLVIGADNTAKHELRAYMGVETVQIHSGGLVAPHCGKFIIRNFGRTMAKDTEIWINGIMTVEDITDFPLGERKIKTVVMPNEKIGLKHEVYWPEDRLGSIYLWGMIKYRDVFDEDHWTIFRFMNDTSTAFFSSDSGPVSGWNAKTCDDGNDAK